MRAILAALVLSITAGCAAVPSCTIGVALIGPLPVPTASCDVTFYREEETSDDE